MGHKQVLKGVSSMGEFHDMVKGYIKLSDTIKINGEAMPETSEPVKVTFQNISDGGRLADNVDFEGKLKGVKVTIELTYAILDKYYYDMLFNAIEKKYIDNGKFFLDITVPTYTPLGVQTYRVYFESEHCSNCTNTSEKHDRDSRYMIGGSEYDELHENVTFKFVQK